MPLNRLKSKNLVLLAAIAVSGILLGSCKKEKRLDRIIANELNKGIRYDSLFLGLKFGISIEEFYNHCWKLNRQGIVKEGPQNMSVEYIFKDSLDNPIAFNFYAHKDGSGIVHQYNTTFYYYAWALNRRLYSDKLLKMLVPILMDWYGGNEPFMQLKDGKKHLFKIDGNRMIDLFIYDESTVMATYIDLTYPGNSASKQ